MALNRLTVTKKNSDTSFAGTVLFNSAFMQKVQNNGTGTMFYLKKTDDNVVPDKYEVSDALSTVDDGLIVDAGVYAIVTVRDDVNDSTSPTTNKVLNLADIIMGIALPSDTSQSLLWVSRAGKKTEKILVDKYLKAFDDLSTTGTTTTYE